MLFNSYTFLLVFLPVTLLGHLLLSRGGSPRAALGWLLLCSLWYYAGWRAEYLLLLGGSILFNYLVGLRLARPTGEERGRRALLIAGIAANLGLLGYFKYADFLLANLRALTGGEGASLGILLPIGISFFTFQQIAYLVDAYRDRSGEYRLVDYALFVTYFPQLIAGPIVHHKEVMPQLARGRQPDARDRAVGLTMFTIGLAKKVLIADSVAVFATPAFAAVDQGHGLTAAQAWLGTLAYTFQLYFDFSGYSDMAIGLARVMGIRLPANFDSPYKARSVVDFWRRWHMTLSRFLRDYLYIALGGNRRGPVRRYVNLMLTMVLGGLWHGAGWGFVVWGFLHGLYLIVNHAWFRVRGRLGLEPERTGAAGRAGAVLLTFLAVIVAWVFFRATTLGGAGRMLASLVGLGTPGAGPAPIDEPGRALAWVVALAAVVWLLPNSQQLTGAFKPCLDFSRARARAAGQAPWLPLAWTPDWRWGLALGVLAVVTLTRMSRASEFIYYQF